ncbi:MAG: HAMP domain-containing histidine kinase [Chitinophagales bacterium]|nr:HAMP domain-containing histidine kinase [Chitinophagales bacterium]
MDIYTRKSNLKLALLITGLVIGAATVLYTNHLASKLANEEKYKANLWAQAIARKAKLVRYTKELFTKLAAEERQKVNVYAQSTKFILTVNDNDVLNFFNDIVTSNNDIPAILTDDKGNIQGARNIELPKHVNQFNQLPAELLHEFSMYQPILVDYKFSISKIYYKDSNLFTKLKQTLSDLVETFISEVVLNTASAPVILTDEKMNVLDYGNIDSAAISTTEKALLLIKDMQSKHDPIVADLGEGVKRYIYYDDSTTLKQLRLFPFIQLGIFAVFLLIAYLAFSNARRAEQNLVWVGMAKETAHQLGTPISSLEGWIEYLRDTESLRGNENIIKELESDVKRLTLVADRFSKIGSVPKLTPTDVKTTLERNVDYMRKRTSAKVQFNLQCMEGLSFNINEQLFDWVLENLIKNALDAMDGEGAISVEAHPDGDQIAIDVADSGKGIPKNKFETIFEPGYSTKRRGWGLGLSLTRRIVQEYHNGKIFVKSSEPGKGTTFRILLPAA